MKIPRMAANRIDQLFGKSLYEVGLTAGPPNIEPDVEAIGPAEHRKPLLQCVDPELTF
jgi:hypothetical protein